MKAICATTILLCIITATYAATSYKPMTINLKPTDTQFQVILPANPTTGYQWTLHNYDRSLLRLVSNQFNPPNSELMGAGGQTVFTFEIINGAVTPSVTSLIFSYARPWENQGGRSQIVTVRFRDTPVSAQ
ncbi:secreted protein [Legionella busanensis]|uniref:Secreted protein n=1 Tax=Legionella busanensis TaxID=190655 RepID=A0A378JLR9_9GAMM|nr:protease inhibitor I42 family protein [Legionella busanensis]STX51638.1 secreted protein [Legionella busanensis]